ncbi:MULTISPECIES: ribosome small subunit-dependent GTPase A [unclassified Butyrivibrio]|jgi:ribosome biogenesis GTPase|uniref:ribosome small subunit-dependent GTPase A n=1 Tax=unclassified Butyrivibrio TaxID=2639466 RepID=UPI00089F73F8|nr:MULTISPECIES: ribosome small subunit-dependent GTPase A [unclassified Butyrivibrio]MBE5839198.1 ribosome small subunit-dependent GTPase A [Butyrivibrio sp.]MBQ9304814.1 ribosome small subunit-dependent GTPase A [Butyrivibrio sp.]SEG05235.1 ribosome biogenesis GTPase [Butyrivibrio sp. Su6]
MRGKILKGIAGFYYIETVEEKIYECKAKGIFRKDNIKPLVGDDANIDIIDEEKRLGNITEILPRKSQLLRPPVANVDQAVILFAIVKPNPSFNLLDRFLIMMRGQNLPVIICFNKQDIATKEEQEELTKAYEKCGYKVLFISVKEEKGLDELKALLKGKTTTLAGPSGVGKSSLLNKLVPDADMQTGELSKKIERGKNTTRHSELFYVKELSDGDGFDTFVIDTPGFTSLELRDVTKENLMEYYPEFEEYEPQCRFGGCSHIAEPDCGVKKALEEGKISKVRYENYKVLYDELRNARPDYSKKARR